MSQKKKPTHFVAFNQKKNTYSIFHMGPLRVNAKTALVPYSDNEYGLVQVAFKGSEKLCNDWAKHTYSSTSDSDLPIQNYGDEIPVLKSNYINLLFTHFYSSHLL